MKFVKMHGLGNDFVVVSQEDINYSGSLKDLAVRICNRHLGVGADGLVVIGPSERADLAMRIYNSDGSEAEMCGNAISALLNMLMRKELYLVVQWLWIPRQA